MTAFVSETFARVAWAVLRTQVSASGDLAVTLGLYDAAAKSAEGRPGSPARGLWARVWHRDSAGTWRIAFETNGIR
ncbi:MAG: nuclear transport factor 2 family protein [Acidobacteriota bacterium]|nr:nuclear transport factor 2 family protein [Acidobacteriota bacterium]